MKLSRVEENKLVGMLLPMLSNPSLWNVTSEYRVELKPPVRTIEPTGDKFKDMMREFEVSSARLLDSFNQLQLWHGGLHCYIWKPHRIEFRWLNWYRIHRAVTRLRNHYAKQYAAEQVKTIFNQLDSRVGSTEKQPQSITDDDVLSADEITYEAGGWR